MRACSCRISALPTGCESGRDRRLCLKRSRLALALVAAALVIGAIALTLRDAFPPGEPGGVVDAEPGPELAHAAATKEPIEELKRVPVDGAHAPDAASVLAEPAPTVPADPPSDAALAELKSVVSTELRSFGEALQLAEAKAGDSEAAYVEFLQVQLRYRMRQEVQQSLEQGEAVLVRAGAQKSVFSREYIRYSTSQKLRNAAAEICVPVLEKSAVPRTQEEPAGAQGVPAPVGCGDSQREARAGPACRASMLRVRAGATWAACLARGAGFLSNAIPRRGLPADRAVGGVRSEASSLPALPSFAGSVPARCA
jgi:hypothetical protein